MTKLSINDACVMEVVKEQMKEQKAEKHDKKTHDAEFNLLIAEAKYQMLMSILAQQNSDKMKRFTDAEIEILSSDVADHIREIGDSPEGNKFPKLDKLKIPEGKYPEEMFRSIYIPLMETVIKSARDAISQNDKDRMTSLIYSLYATLSSDGGVIETTDTSTTITYRGITVGMTGYFPSDVVTDYCAIAQLCIQSKIDCFMQGMRRMDFYSGQIE